MTTAGEAMVPEHYGDPAAEYAAVREAVGLIERPGAGLVRIAGPDRAGFLHGVVSCEIKKLPVGRGAYGMLLNTTGHVVADLVALALPDELLVLPSPGLAGRVAADLEKFHIMEKVTITDLSAATAVIGLHGPAAGDLLNDAFSLDVLNPEEHQHFEMSFQGTAVRAVACRPTGGPGFEFLVPGEVAAAFRAAVMQRGADHGLRPVGAAAREILRIEAGRPRHPNEINEGVLGPELDVAAAFAPGKCYPGQEVVARIQARGHVNRKLFGIRVEGQIVPDVGDEVWLAGGVRKVATVTSATLSPALGAPIALGLVRKEAFTPDTAVEIRHGGQVLAARTCPLPFVSGNAER